MSAAQEQSGQFGGMASGLLAGLRQLSDDQRISFTRYIRHVLPLDGFVFWLRTEDTQIQGSLHVSVDQRQNEDETVSANRVVLSTGEKVDRFSQIDPQTLWVGEYAGVRFVLVSQGYFYEAAGLFHYVGEQVFPALESQLVDVGQQLSADTLVVSNSLPAWLSIKDYAPVWLNPPNPGVTLYPSFSVPDNLRPPYGAVHIDPVQTVSWQSAPFREKLTNTHHELASDHVRVTFYGLTNAQALDWFDTALDYSLNMNVIGLMNTPIMRDEKRPQAGLGVLAMKKTIEFDVSYDQGTVRDVARQLVETASATINANCTDLIS